jgi:hypothetical protein
LIISVNIFTINYKKPKMIYKILDPTDPYDKEKFYDIMNCYVDSNSRLFPKEDNIRRSNLYKKLFDVMPKKDFIVSGKFENDCLVKFLIC